ncbi:MAG TPA: thioredoxin domain-containing protein [Terriglobales bacterium]
MIRNLQLTTLVLLASLAFAQDAVNPALRPPAGAQVAIIAFEDLECPDCRREHPKLEEAARTNNVPLVLHDFPLPFHEWSFEAAVTARYFDARSKDLGNQYRDYIFQNQPEINKDNLRSYSEKFAAQNKLDLPANPDPNGKFAAQVTADRDLANSIGIRRTPTIYVVSDKIQKPFIEVIDRTELNQLIQAMKSE